MIRVVAKFYLKDEETEAKAMPLFKELVETTRKEAGCKGYDLVKATGEENVYAMLEAWESKDVLDIHSASEHFTRLVPQLVSMCSKAPQIDSYILV